MNMPEALKLVPVESQPADYLVTYASGDTAFFEQLPESLPAGCMVQEQQTTPAQDEPVARVRNLVNCTILDSTGCKRHWEDLPDGTALYAAPQSDKLRQAAEEILSYFEGKSEHGIPKFVDLIDSLRAALEGK